MWMWDVIVVSVPDHCLSFYFSKFLVSLKNSSWNIGQDVGCDCISSWSLLIFLLFKVFGFTEKFLLKHRAGCGIWLYQFLIIAYLFTFQSFWFHWKIPLETSGRIIAYLFTFQSFWFHWKIPLETSGSMWDVIVSVPDHCLSFYFSKCLVSLKNSSWNIGQDVGSDCIRSWSLLIFLLFKVFGFIEKFLLKHRAGSLLIFLLFKVFGFTEKFLLKHRAACGMWLYQFLIIAYLFTFQSFWFHWKIPLETSGRMWDLIVSVPDHCLSFYFSKFLVSLKNSSWNIGQDVGSDCISSWSLLIFLLFKVFGFTEKFLLKHRAGCGIWLYQFLIIAYLFTFQSFWFHWKIPLETSGRMWDLIVSVPDHCLSFYFSKFLVSLKISSWKGNGLMGVLS